MRNTKYPANVNIRQWESGDQQRVTKETSSCWQMSHACTCEPCEFSHGDFGKLKVPPCGELGGGEAVGGWLERGLVET